MTLLVFPWVFVFGRHFIIDRRLVWRASHDLRSIRLSYLGSLVILGFACKAVYLEERSWFAKDQLSIRLGHHLSTLDALVFEAVKKECHKLVGDPIWVTANSAQNDEPTNR